MITALSSTGEGIGTLEGRKVFVEGALPLEEVEVSLVQEKKNYAIGKLEKILLPSKLRQKPLCPLFGECGGCQLMHLNDEGQLIVKRQKVIDALERIGGFKGIDIAPCIASPKPLYYRNKIQLPIVWDAKTSKIGLFRKNSHEIIPLEHCFIQDSLGEKIFKNLRPLIDVPAIRYLLIRTTAATNEALVIFVADRAIDPHFGEKIMATTKEIKGVLVNINKRDDNVILGPDFHLLAGRSYLIDTLGSKSFRISAPSFFQVNPGQALQLFETAIQWAEISPSDQVIDAFCGVGTLALFAADKTKKVIGIECVSHAIEDAKENARLNQSMDCQFFVGKAEEVISTLPFADVLFLNPPRKGCEPTLLHQIEKQKPRTIIYISCDPATLARDLKILAGVGYNIDGVQPFDMFPQTTHIETLVKVRL